MNGFVNLLKPPGMTSSDAVLCVRKMLPRGTKVGHGGTLDPDAAGVLPVSIGSATRLFEYIIDKEKEYLAQLTLGVVTDTQDATGRVLARTDVLAGEEEIRANLSRLTGETLQTPPAYSAIKRNGRRMYDMARAGEATQLEARPIFVKSLDYVANLGYNTHMLRVVCRKGVYVRTLMHDLGGMLGCGGHMSFLLRTRAGAFEIARSVTFEELRRDGVEAHLCDNDFALAHLPAVRLAQRWEAPVRNGNPVSHGTDLATGTIVRVYLEDAFAGIGEIAGAFVRFRAMLL